MRTTRVFTADADGALKGGPLSGRKVLIVEDEALVALDLELTVEGEGAEVVGPFSRLAAALDAVEEGTLDMAILDIMLGAEEVFPLAKRLEESGVPFVFHSGHADPETLRREYPSARICSKPCAPSVIVSTLEELSKDEAS